MNEYKVTLSREQIREYVVKAENRDDAAHAVLEGHAPVRTARNVLDGDGWRVGVIELPKAEDTDPTGTVRRCPRENGFSHVIKLTQGENSPQWMLIDAYGDMGMMDFVDVEDWEVVYVPKEDES